MGNIGFTEILLLLVVALLLFGPKKLPELGRALGRTLREFKNGARDLMEEHETPQRKEVHPDQPEAPKAEFRKMEQRPQDNKRLPE